MDLKDFVAQTLIQIVEGVRLAAGPVSQMGGYVSPAHMAKIEGNVVGQMLDGKQGAVYSVKFDVAVVAETDSKLSGGGGLKVMGMRLGADAASGEKEQTSSRIQFIVPIALPVDQGSQAAADKRTQELTGQINRALTRR